MADLPHTIDAEHARTESLHKALASGEAMPPRELRRIWETRHRPFWRLYRGLYVQLAKRLIGAGENYLAIDVASEGKSFFGDDPALLFQEALASARSGSVERARELLLSHRELGRSEEDAAALLARLYKDAWKTTGQTQYLQAAFENYLAAYQGGLNPAFTGTNAASMALLLGHKEEAAELAMAVLQGLSSGQFLQGDAYWDTVTQAECQLDLGMISHAKASYAAAAALPDIPRANLLTTRAQARLLLPCHGHSPRAFDECFPIPAVACFTGHRIDEEGRKSPRFPASRENAVREEIAAAIHELNIGIGFSAAANGGDLLFVEALHASGGEAFIYLPMRQLDFKHLSVEIENTDWGHRFDQALANADAVYELETPPSMPASEVFQYGNKICLGAALRKARELDTDLVVLAVWNGDSGQQGGTGDFIRMATERNCDVIVIDPSGSSGTSVLNHAPPVTPSSIEWPIYSVATLCLGSHADETRLKELIDRFGSTIVNISMDGRCVCLLFDNTHTATNFAWNVLEATSKQILQLSSAIGLHAGPMRITRSILTGSAVPEGTHAAIASDLARIEPHNYIYASTEFVSLAELDAIKGVRFEYLGQQKGRDDSYPRSVFRMIRE